MQLYAFDRQRRVIAARSATKGNDYSCMECGTSVRLRGGHHKQLHFYHLSSKGECRQKGKGMLHLQIQETLFKLLPAGECLLEHPFPSISRIADVVWEPKKLIIEVQCSPITLAEVQGRLASYRSLGYQVVWILHEKTFNKRNVTAAEKHLREGAVTYYTNLDLDGKGVIYDQLERVEAAKRIARSHRVPVNLLRPQPLYGTHRPFPRELKKRIERWPLHFEGDVIDRLFSGEIPSDQIGKEQKNVELPPRKALWAFCKRLYSLSLQMLLETCCR